MARADGRAAVHACFEDGTSKRELSKGNRWRQRGAYRSISLPRRNLGRVGPLIEELL